MEDERFKAMKNWLQLKLMRDIQVFIGFANFHWRFIWGFSRIAAPLTSMLKTIRSSDLALRELGANEVIEDGDKVDDKNLSKKLKNAKFIPYIWLKELSIIYSSFLLFIFWHMTSPRDFIQFCSINKVLLIEHFFMIPRFFESCDIICDFFCSR